MGRTPENEALAAAIINFIRTEFAIDAVIDGCPDGGYLIETDAGASFTFEICGATKAAVARAYFEHIRQVWRHALEERTFIYFYRANRKERERLKRQLAKMNAWARQHLRG